MRGPRGRLGSPGGAPPEDRAGLLDPRRVSNRRAERGQDVGYSPPTGPTATSGASTAARSALRPVRPKCTKSCPSAHRPPTTATAGSASGSPEASPPQDSSKAGPPKPHPNSSMTQARTAPASTAAATSNSTASQSPAGRGAAASHIRRKERVPPHHGRGLPTEGTASRTRPLPSVEHQPRRSPLWDSIGRWSVWLPDSRCVR